MTNKAHETGPAIPPKLHHATFLTLKLDEMVAWYGQVTGVKPLYYGEQGAWMTNDEANHRIALVAHPLIKKAIDKPTSQGHHHTAFEYHNLGEWVDNYLRLKAQGILPFMVLDHGMTLSAYYADPEGNGVEIQVDNFGDWVLSKEWIWASPEFDANPIGQWVDADKLAADWVTGEFSAKEIHEKAYSGGYVPENPPTDILLPEVY